MKTILILAELLVVAVCSVSLFSTVTRAQSTNVQGSFRLQNQVQWDRAVLPPGTYSFTLESTADNTIYAIVRSADGKKTALAMATTTAAAEPGDSFLFMTNDGRRRVRLLNLPKLNLSLAFGPFTNRDREFLYATKAQTVPVTVAEK